MKKGTPPRKTAKKQPATRCKSSKRNQSQSSKSLPKIPEVPPAPNRANYSHQYLTLPYFEVDSTAELKNSFVRRGYYRYSGDDISPSDDDLWELDLTMLFRNQGKFKFYGFNLMNEVVLRGFIRLFGRTTEKNGNREVSSQNIKKFLLDQNENFSYRLFQLFMEQKQALFEDFIKTLVHHWQNRQRSSNALVMPISSCKESLNILPYSIKQRYKNVRGRRPTWRNIRALLNQNINFISMQYSRYYRLKEQMQNRRRQLLRLFMLFRSRLLMIRMKFRKNSFDENSDLVLVDEKLFKMIGYLQIWKMKNMNVNSLKSASSLSVESS